MAGSRSRVGYVVATSTHFVLHRTVVFRARGGLPAAAVAAAAAVRRASWCCQYAVTTLAMTFLPGLLGLPEILVFFAVAACVTVASFVVLRTRLFH